MSSKILLFSDCIEILLKRTAQKDQTHTHNTHTQHIRLTSIYSYVILTTVEVKFFPENTQSEELCYNFFQ